MWSLFCGPQWYSRESPRGDSIFPARVIHFLRYFGSNLVHIRATPSDLSPSPPTVNARHIGYRKHGAAPVLTFEPLLWALRFEELGIGLSGGLVEPPVMADIH